MGDVIGGYRILGVAGVGGMGVVYRAEDPRLGRMVALKVVAPALAGREGFRRRFLAEAQAAAALEHPNAVPVYGAGEADGILWIAMRFVEGESLAALVAARGRLAPGRAARLVSQAAAALDAAHARGLVHLDVTPANLLIADPGGDDQVYLSDFGLSRWVGGDGGTPPSDAGTPGYAAPEVLAGAATGPAADVYSLGCVLFHALTGDHPVPGDGDRPPRLTDLVPDLPDGYDRVVARALAGDPDDRYPTAGALADAVLALRDEVVLVYGPGEEPFAHTLARDLRAQGVRVVPVSDDPGEVAQGIRVADVCAVLVGPGGAGAWSRAPLDVAESIALRDRAFRIVGVLLPGAPDPLDPSLGFLTGRSWADLRAGAGDPSAMRALTRLVRGRRRTATAPSGASDVCPYQGLAAFGEDQAHLFHGREGETARAVELLRAGRFLAVVGPSGSGKSSLARAGIVPALRSGPIPGARTSEYLRVTPGARPLGALAAGLREAIGPGAPDEDLLAGDPAALDRAVQATFASRDRDDRLVLLVDQFEEAFTLAPPTEREAFIDSLVLAATIPAGRVVVLLTLRADMVAAVAAHPRLAALVAGRQLLIGPLTPDGLRRAIEEPARSVGLDLEEGLTRRIVSDVGGRAGALPLLEDLLTELWRHRRDGLLTTESYAASGGIEGALAQRADIVFAALPDGRRETARRVLLGLVQPGDGAEDSRRRVEVEELRSTAGDPGDVDAVIEALTAERLLSVGRDEATGARVVEITHEALIRAWPQLRGWLEDDREALRRRLRLSEAAAEWEASGREEGLLYRGSRLAAWQEAPGTDLSPRERAFLDASVRRAERERAERTRRVRLGLAALAVALVVVAAVAAIAVLQGAEAREQRDAALSRQLAVNAQASLADDPELALLLAREAYAAAPTVAAEEALRQAAEETRLARAVSPTGDELFGVAAVPRGPVVAIGTEEGRTLVVDAATGETLASRAGNGEAVPRVDVDAAGRLIAAGDEGGTVTVWDWRADRVVARLRVPGDEVRGVSLTADGRRIAAAMDGGTVRVWSVAGGGPPEVLRGHDGRVGGVDWNPDGRRLATVGDDGTARVWDAQSGTGRILGRHGPSTHGVAWSPDGRRFVTSGVIGGEGWALVWDPDGGRRPVRLGPQGTEVYQSAWSADGATIATAGSDSTVRLWNARGGPVRIVLRPHDGTTNGVVFTADGRSVASTDSAGTLRVWDVDPARERTVLAGHDRGVLGASWRPDGSRIVSGGNDGTVRIWDPATGDSRVLRGHGSEVWSASYSPDGRRLLTGSLDTTARVWDAGTDRVMRVFGGHDDIVFDAAWSPVGDVVASGDVTGRLLVWDARTGRIRHRLDARALVWGIRFTPDGAYMVTGDQDGFVRVWDVAAGREEATLTGHEGAVWRPSFSPDGRQVASIGDDGVLRVWEWRSGDPPLHLRGHQGRGFDALFSPDGSLIATSGEDMTVRVWDWRRAVTVAVFRGHADAALRLAWSPDGTRLLSSSDDGDIRVWRCGTCGPMADVLRLGEARAVRELTAEEREVFFSDR